MKAFKTLVASLVLLSLSGLAAAAQKAGAPNSDTASSPKEEFVEPTPELRSKLCTQVWHQIAEEYFDESKLTDWDKVATKCDGKIESDEQLDAVLTEMVKVVGDRWTKYQSRPIIRAHQQMKADGFLQAGVLSRRHGDGAWHIDSLAWGSPAHLSVLKEGDVIVSVNGKPLNDRMSDVDVWDLFVGKEGDTVKVVAKIDGKEQEVAITLFPTPEEKVTVSILPNDVLYIRLPTFEKAEVVQDFVSKLRKAYFEKKGALTGVVFDLRNNPGGLFDFALLVSSAFIESGTITKATLHKGPAETVTDHNVRPMPPFAKRLIKEEHQLDFLNWAHNTPMVVLINGSSASCSEITAGALQDNKRAYVIGTQSFGKSVGFTMNQLPNGAVLTVTSLKYLTPAGHDIVDKGITPDLVISQPRQGSEDLALKAADEYIVKLAEKRFQQVQDSRKIAGKSKDELADAPHSANRTLVALLLAFMGSIVTLGVVVIMRHR